MPKTLAAPRRVFKFPATNPLLIDWLQAAEDWRRLQSDPAEARCRVARAAYYRAVWGHVPPVREARNG